MTLFLARPFLLLLQHASIFVRHLHGEGAPATVCRSFAGSSGKTLTSAEKHASIAEKINSQGVVLGWPTVTASNVDNKIDAVRRKQ